MDAPRSVRFRSSSQDSRRGLRRTSDSEEHSPQSISRVVPASSSSRTNRPKKVAFESADVDSRLNAFHSDNGSGRFRTPPSRHHRLEDFSQAPRGRRHGVASVETSPRPSRRASVSSAASDDGCYRRMGDVVSRRTFPTVEPLAGDAVYANVPLLIREDEPPPPPARTQESPVGSSRESVSSANAYGHRGSAMPLVPTRRHTSRTKWQSDDTETGGTKSSEKTAKVSKPKPFDFLPWCLCSKGDGSSRRSSLPYGKPRQRPRLPAMAEEASRRNSTDIGTPEGELGFLQHLCLCAVCRAQMQSCQLLAQLVSEAQGAAGPLTAIQSPLGFGLYRRRQVRAPLSESPPSEEQHDSFESGGRDDYNFLREPESEGSTFYDDDAEPVLLPEQACFQEEYGGGEEAFRQPPWDGLVGGRSAAQLTSEAKSGAAKSSARSWASPHEQQRRGAMGNILSCFHGSFSPSDAEHGHKLMPVAPRPPADGKSDSIVQVQGVNLRLADNTQRHRTDDYEMTKGDDPVLVVRRGEPFKLTLELSRQYNVDRDALAFVFTVRGEEAPSYTKNTVAVVPLGFRSSNEAFRGTSSWNAVVLSSRDTFLDVEITPPPNVIVGDWIMDIDSKSRSENDNTGFRYTHKDPIYILFNPWCRGDTVYMDDTKMRYECVLMESGLIWRGSHSRLRPTVWSYGQVNSPNDEGVVEGNWTEKFSGGTAPTGWTGSASILQQFYKTKKPVKYGQCWVFAGVTTTVLRALGIPSRPVTNYYSAHDTHSSLTVDQFYDDNGEPIEKLNKDSIWNFHVWNEAWMMRPDLEPGDYSGWQAIDSTPQEASDGIYRCGPASVKAIKRAEILKPYDGTFIFAEVNADQIYWRYQGPLQPLKLIRKATDKIGQCISTKAVGRFDREDITDSYKHPEHTKEERDTMLKALRKCNHAYSRYYLNDELEDISFDFGLIDDIVIGSPFTVKLSARNKNPTKEYHAHVIMRVETTHYTGNNRKLVKTDQFDVTIKPNSREEVGLEVTYQDYEKLLLDQAIFNIATMATIKESKFDFFAQDDFRVRMPDVKIETDSDALVGKQLHVKAGFRNPLPKPLTKGVFVIEGPGLAVPLRLPVKQKVPAGGEAKVSFYLTPKTAGPKAIIAKFSSKELSDVDGFKSLDVREASFLESANVNAIAATA
ncbi:annulin-like isoform X2 [Haemaphysalis longicornis]